MKNRNILYKDSSHLKNQTDQSRTNSYKLQKCVQNYSNKQPQQQNVGQVLKMIYLRLYNKRSIKIFIATKVSISEIKAIIFQNFKVKPDELLLFVNGKDVTDYSYILMQQQKIVHILSKDQLSNRIDRICIKIKVINFLQPQKKILTTKFSVPASQTVSQFVNRLKQHLNSVCQTLYRKNQFFLLQSGRILQFQKPFFEQNISKNTQIICLITDHILKTKFVSDCTKRKGSKVASNETAKQLNSRAKIKKLSQTSKSFKRFDIAVSPMKPSQNLDNQYLIFSTSMPNFKKKRNTNDSFDLIERPLIRKIKSLKPKQQIDHILDTEMFQKYFQQSPKRKSNQTSTNLKSGSKLPPFIPKQIPLKQRRAIRMQVQQLFTKPQNIIESNEIENQTKGEN